jgi:hypothetical protein
LMMAKTSRRTATFWHLDSVTTSATNAGDFLFMVAPANPPPTQEVTPPPPTKRPQMCTWRSYCRVHTLYRQCAYPLPKSWHSWASCKYTSLKLFMLIEII